MGAISTAPPAIHLCQVTKTYGTGNRAVTALRGVNLDLQPGQLVMLAGPSGCGKTTLVSIITGILSPTSGDVEVFGTRWSQLSKDEQTRRRGELIGYVFQQFHLIL
jgi:putative ABC transport system ATP-binding protein